jgi:hypothetical protein
MFGSTRFCYVWQHAQHHTTFAPSNPLHLRKTSGCVLGWRQPQCHVTLTLIPSCVASLCTSFCGPRICPPPFLTVFLGLHSAAERLRRPHGTDFGSPKWPHEHCGEDHDCLHEGAACCRTHCSVLARHQSNI